MQLARLMHLHGGHEDAGQHWHTHDMRHGHRFLTSFATKEQVREFGEQFNDYLERLVKATKTYIHPTSHYL